MEARILEILCGTLWIMKAFSAAFWTIRISVFFLFHKGADFFFKCCIYYLFIDCERMQRSPIHSFVVVVVVFDFQVCKIFVLNEGKLKPVDKTCWQNLWTKPVEKTCWQNLLTKPVDKTCLQNMLTCCQIGLMT